MKALRWHGPRDLRLVELVEPVLKTGEVRIRVAYCGICGSDLHEYVDGPHAIPVDSPHPISGRRAPLTLGHEFCGTVVESAEPGVRAGMRVAVEPEYRCGRCDYCRVGQYNRCTDMGFVGLMGDGAFAETVVVPSYTVHPLPDEISFVQAAVFEPAAVALHAVRSSGLRAGDACAVFGMGPVGLLTDDRHTKSVARADRAGWIRCFACRQAPSEGPRRAERGGCELTSLLSTARAGTAN